MPRLFALSRVASVLILSAALASSSFANDTPSPSSTSLPLDPSALERQWRQIEAKDAPEDETALLFRAVLYVEGRLLQSGENSPELERLSDLRRRIARHLWSQPDAQGLAPSNRSAKPPLMPRRAEKMDPIVLNGAENCQDAPLIEPGIYLGSTADAADDRSVTSCVLSSAAPDVWYRLPTPELFFLSTVGSEFDTVLSAHFDCPGVNESTSFACSDQGPNGSQSASLGIDPFQNEVWIKVTGPSISDSGDFQLSVERGGSISGRLLDEDGAPLGNHDVEVLSSFFLTYGAITRPDGTFITEELEAGTYRLAAIGQGEFLSEVYDDIPCPGNNRSCRLDDGDPIEVARGTETVVPDIRLRRGGVVEGRAFSRVTGEAVTQGMIVLTGLDLTFQEFYFPDSEGRYRAVGLPPGKYQAFFASSGEFAVQAWPSIDCGGDCSLDSGTPLTVVAGQTLAGIDFDLVRLGVITGLVTDTNGVGLDFIPVFLRDLQGSRISDTFTDSNGNYSLAGLRAGTYLLIAAGQDFGHSSPFVPELYREMPCISSPAAQCDFDAGTRLEVTLESRTDNIDFTLSKGGRISGRVTDLETGEPVRSQIVSIFSSRDSQFEAFKEGVTDEQGRYSIAGLPGGDYFLIAGNLFSTANVASVYPGIPCVEGCPIEQGSPVNVVFEQERANIDFGLHRTSRVHGRVTESATGIPIAGLELTLAGSSFRFAQTGEDGRYFFESVLPGQHTVSTESSIFLNQNLEIEIEPGQDLQGVDFALLSGATIQGTLTASQGELPSDQQLTLELIEVSDGRSFTFFPGPGAYRTTTIPPGDYFVRVSVFGFATRVWPGLNCNGFSMADCPGAQALAIEEGATLSGIDFVLEPLDTCATDERLCALDNRFQLTARWATGEAQGSAGASAITNETGYFWFFDVNNVEVVVKVLDACNGFDHFWVFAAGLTNVEVDLSVVDTWTGSERTYFHPAGMLFAPLFDTQAFATCDVTAPLTAGSVDSRPGPNTSVVSRTDVSLPAKLASPDALSPLPEPAGTSVETSSDAMGFCTSDAQTVCLNGDRFEISATWSTDDSSGEATAVRLTDDTAYFWFFGPDNIEVVVKVLDACEAFDRFWVFAAGLTNVEVEITVKSLTTGEQTIYRNRRGDDFVPIADTGTLTCPMG